jgi:hypothetical protein
MSPFAGRTEFGLSVACTEIADNTKAIYVVDRPIILFLCMIPATEGRRGCSSQERVEYMCSRCL